jgi:hypothetical protein
VLFPFLLYGFLVATCQTAQGYTLGFMIIDKLQLTPIKALGFISVAMAAGAMAGLLAQWGLIRIFNMGPRALLRWGVALACLGMGLVLKEITNSRYETRYLRYLALCR